MTIAVAEQKDRATNEDIRRMQQNIDKMSTEISMYRNMADEINKQQLTRANLLADLQKFNQLVQELEQYKVTLEKKLQARYMQWEFEYMAFC